MLKKTSNINDHFHMVNIESKSQQLGSREKWRSCSPVTATTLEHFELDFGVSGNRAHIIGDGHFFVYQNPHGSFNSFRIAVQAADATNFITQVLVYGRAPGVNDLIYNNGANRKVQGVYQYDMGVIANRDDYNVIHIVVGVDVDANHVLDYVDPEVLVSDS